MAQADSLPREPPEACGCFRTHPRLPSATPAELKEPLETLITNAAQLRVELAGARDSTSLAERAARIERAAETMRRLVGA